MKAIAKDFGLTGYSSITKEQVFKMLFNHMTTVEDCGICQGDCDPLKHIFPATEEAPPSHSQSSPNAGRTTRTKGGVSPQSVVLRHDKSKDKPVGETGSNASLYEDQPEGENGNEASPHIDASPKLPLRQKVAAGGRTFQPDETLAAELAENEKRVQETLDAAEAEEEERRSRELAELDDSDVELSSEDDEDYNAALAAQTKRQEEAAAAKHEAKEREHQQKLQAARDAKAKKQQKRKSPKRTATITVNVPRGPVKSALRPPAKKPTRRSVRIDEVTIPDKQSDEQDDVFQGPMSPRSMMEFMSNSLARALDKRDNTNRRSLPIGSAGPNNINGVPDGAPDTGRLALRSVPNTLLADRLGVAPAPNLVIEGNRTVLDVQKLQKHMKSGSKRTQC